MTKKELLEKMKESVDTYVKSYKSDFDIDKQLIDEWGNRWWVVWVVRDFGTQLQRFTNSLESMSYINAVFDSMSGSIKKVYIVECNGKEYAIYETTYDEVKSRYKKMDQYEIEVFGTPYYTYTIRKTEGAFDSEKDANEMGEWLMNKMGGGSFRIERKGGWY